MTNNVPTSEEQFKELRDSFVLAVLKRRVYYGKSHETKLEDLKAASREILDYVDDVIKTGVNSKAVNAQIQLLERLMEQKQSVITESMTETHSASRQWVEAVPVSVIQTVLDELTGEK